MYEYACAACGHEDTLLEKHSAAKSKKCPKCLKPRQFKRQLSAPSFQLKGTGWYATDFRDQAKKPAKDEKADAKAPDKAKDGGKGSEAKPATSSADAATGAKPKDRSTAQAAS